MLLSFVVNVRFAGHGESAAFLNPGSRQSSPQRLTLLLIGHRRKMALANHIPAISKSIGHFDHAVPATGVQGYTIGESQHWHRLVTLHADAVGRNIGLEELVQTPYDGFGYGLFEPRQLTGRP